MLATLSRELGRVWVISMHKANSRKGYHKRPMKTMMTTWNYGKVDGDDECDDYDGYTVLDIQL